MNIITNILFSIYLYFLFKIDNYLFYIVLFGIIFPYFEIFLAFFIKNKLKIVNKIFHSIFILIVINLALSLVLNICLSLNFINVFLFLFLGNFIHLFSDLLKNKKVYLVYPITENGFNLSISNYFDIVPVIILILSNFFIIFLEFKITILEKLFPILFLLTYFLFRFFIKRIILKKILIDDKNNYKVLVHPTLKVTVWNIIRVTQNTVYLFQLDIIKRKYLFVKYFSNKIINTDLDVIESSTLFIDFKSNNNYLYYQTYEFKKDIKFVRVFDVKNFFNLFKREQRYYEAKFVKNKIIKEKIIL